MVMVIFRRNPFRTSVTTNPARMGSSRCRLPAVIVACADRRVGAGRRCRPTPYTPRASSRTTLPSCSSITRRRIESTIVLSWVAISTVVPVRLIRSSSSMMSALVSGSRLPVGSSASSSIGRLANARAIATRCCSPPDSSCGSRLALPSRPTISSTSGTTCLIDARERPITSRANPTFCSTVLLVSSRKSWNTHPSRRRWAATFDRRRCTRSLPSTSIDAGRRHVLADQQAQKRRLARSGRADDEGEFALVDVDR